MQGTTSPPVNHNFIRPLWAGEMRLVSYLAPVDKHPLWICCTVSCLTRGNSPTSPSGARMARRARNEEVTSSHLTPAVSQCRCHCLFIATDATLLRSGLKRLLLDEACIYLLGEKRLSLICNVRIKQRLFIFKIVMHGGPMKSRLSSLSLKPLHVSIPEMAESDRSANRYALKPSACRRTVPLPA